MMHAVLTDIEGTTSAIAFVKETLFPFARAQMADFCRQHVDDPEVRPHLDAVRADTNTDLEGAIETLIRWIDEDRKVTALKALQGLIWRDGYRSGTLLGHVYPDARDRLTEWHNAGRPLYVYSSGSEEAQRLLFGHSVFGDLTPLFSGYFDTRIGPKKEADSYTKIAMQIQRPASEIVFLSDVVAELDAARHAGLKTYRLVRPEDQTPAGSDHREVTTFLDIEL